MLLCFTSSPSACEFDNVTFDNKFSTARLTACKELASDRYLLIIKPENTPINDSAWYSFKVSSKAQSVINVTLKYTDGNQRYLPKISSDGESWEYIPFKKNRRHENKISFDLKVDKTSVWVAGQEIINNEHYISWNEELVQKTAFKLAVLGKSEEGRNIYQLHSSSQSNEWLVIVGRMHPPEITGALALFPFVGEFSINQELPNKFRERFNVLVIPNLNPDGVEKGNWRHNANGVDLNRDWVTLKQRETQLVHNKLQEIEARGGKIIFAIDFHSTRGNVFYTMPTDYGVFPPLLVNNWLKELDRLSKNFNVVIKPGNNPDKGVFKQYIADNYKVQAVTYEMGDNENRKIITSIAKLAAQTLMTELLKTKKEQFLGDN